MNSDNLKSARQFRQQFRVAADQFEQALRRSAGYFSALLPLLQRAHGYARGAGKFGLRPRHHQLPLRPHQNFLLFNRAFTRDGRAAGGQGDRPHGALSGAAVRRGRGRHRGCVRARERQQAIAHPGAEKTASGVFAASPVIHYFIDSCLRTLVLRYRPI